MNFLFLNWKDVKNPEVGGAEVIAFEFAKRLVQDGNSVTFFSRKFNDCLENEKIDKVNIIRRGGKITVYLHAFLFWMENGSKFDKVIDMINTICWMTPLYVPAKKRIAYLNQLAKEVFFYELPFPISYIMYFLERFEYLPYRKDTKFVCYSESSKKDLIGFGIKSKKISLFPMGLDHKRYFPRDIKSKFPHFIFVARLVRMKRPDLCIEALELVKKSHPEVVLSIVGNGPIERNLKEYANKKNLKKNVKFISKNNFHLNKKVGDPKVDLMQRAWCLLLPSVKEGWGMVVTEAAACGTPSIATNVSGLSDSVVDGKTGILISSRPTSEELAGAMLKILNEKERVRMSKNCVRWSSNFDWDKSYYAFKKLLI